MQDITTEELGNINTEFYERLCQMRSALVEETIAPLRGRGHRTIRKLKDPATGEFREVQVLITVTGGGIGYDEDLQIEGTYVHPFTGKIVEALLDV
jgi:hypothetical protein